MHSAYDCTRALSHTYLLVAQYNVSIKVGYRGLLNPLEFLPHPLKKEKSGFATVPKIRG